MTKVLTGKISHPGVAEGEVLLLTEPISFWGGVDHHGEIIDVHHAQHKAKMTNKILVMPSGRGSSSATAVLAELIRTGDGPLAIVMLQCDTILVSALWYLQRFMTSAFRLLNLSKLNTANSPMECGYP